MKTSTIALLVLTPLTVGTLLGSALPPALAAEPPSSAQTKAQPEYRPYDYLLSTEQAIQFYQDRVKRDPQDSGNYTLLGQMYIRRARETGNYALYDRAEAAMRRALELDRDSLGAQINQALILSARHKFRESVQLAQRLYQKHPGEPQILLVIGDAHLELGNYTEAENAYRELQSKDRLAFLATRQARLAELKGNTAEALRLMQQAAAEEQRARMSKEGGAWYQVRLGDLHYSIGHLEEAAQHYQAALKILAQCAPALAGLAQVRVAQGQYEVGIDLYKQAIHINPDCYLLAALGDVYAKTGNRALAQILYDKLDRTAGLGEGAFDRELSLFYSNHDQKVDKALELAKQDLTVRKDIYAYDTLAWALCKNKQYDVAAQAMAEALKLGTREASLYYHAGMIFHGLGNKQRARANLELALRINPYFSLLQAEQAKRTLAALGN